MGWMMRLQKGVQFSFLDCYRYALLEAAGLALNGNVTTVTASHGNDVDADVLIGGAGERRFPFGPFRPGPALCEVPQVRRLRVML